MFVFKKSKKQDCPYKDFGDSKEVDKLLDYTENKYEEILERWNKKEIEYFEGLNKISKQVSSDFDLKIIELADLRLEYLFKDKLLSKFFFGALVVFLLQFISNPTSQLYQAIFEYCFSWIPQGKSTSIVYSGSLITLIGTYLYFVLNNRINQKQRIIKYALILNRYQIEGDARP